MSEETKTPQPGEWWRCEGQTFYCCGSDIDGDPVFQRADEEFAAYTKEGLIYGWHHEPRCTSFEWVEPSPPDPGEGYELLPVGTMLQEGDECLQRGGGWEPTSYPGEAIGSNGWVANTYRRKIKPVEPARTPDNRPARDVIVEMMYILDDTFETDATNAKKAFLVGEQWLDDNPEDPTTTAAVTVGEIKFGSQIPDFRGESPDDWVEITDENHKLRAGIDQMHCDGNLWVNVDVTSGLTKRGITRCRRKDLPAKLATPAINPGEGYRLLEDHEEWLPTDERAYTDCMRGDEKDWGLVRLMIPDRNDKTVGDLRVRGREHLIVRRKIDTPAEPKRIPVRLWCSDLTDVRESRNVYIRIDGGVPTDCIEIKCGPDGFYVVEGGE